MTRFTCYTGLLLILVSCSGLRVTNKWKATDAEPPVYKRIMVIGLTRNSDQALRNKMENHMVGDITALGYNAFSSYELYGPKAFDGLDEQEAIKKLGSSGADAVVTIVLLDKTRERNYIPGKIYYSPYSLYSQNFWGYYSTMYGRIEQPGYYLVNTKYFLESNLYDVSGNKLLYSIQTESFDPSSVESLGHEYGKLIIKSMVKDKVLQQHSK